MRRFAAFAALVLSVALVAPCSSTTGAALAQTSSQAAPEFRTGTAVVLLDVIARDKKGRPVRDLKAEELQVFENGQRCEVRSFRLVESQATIEPGATGAVSAPVAPVEVPRAGGEPAEGQRAPFNLVTLVFDRMSLEESRLAEKAARDFVLRRTQARTQAAVFTIGRGLSLVQPFTSEKEALLAAIAVATSGKDLKDRSLTVQAQQASRNAALASDLPVGGQLPETGDVTQPSGERITGSQSRQPGVPQDRRGPDFLNWIARALRMADGLQRQMEGEWSIYPLLALVKAQAPLAGRKTLIFFSSGVQVPPNLQDVFRCPPPTRGAGSPMWAECPRAASRPERTRCA